MSELRGHRNPRRLPDFTLRKILEWVDAYRRRTGRWPTPNSGPIQDAPGETWCAVQVALAQGGRGMPGGSSLPALLAKKRGVRNQVSLPDHSVKQILRWADAHRKRTGSWPSSVSGPIHEDPAEKWPTVDEALRAGRRGLAGGSSLAKLLAERRGVRNYLDPPRLTRSQILRWITEHRRRHGKFPTEGCGPIANSGGETWAAVASALRVGRRGLRGGSSLARLVARVRKS